MLFRRSPTTSYRDCQPRYPTILTTPDPFTLTSKRQWTYQRMRESYRTPIPFGSIIRMEDTSEFSHFFIGKITRVLAHFENVLIVTITSVSHEAGDADPPSSVQLTLPLGIIRLSPRQRIIRWCLECIDRLPHHYPRTSASLRESLEEFGKQFGEIEISEASTENLGGEILVRSSKDYSLDILLRQVRSLVPLSPLTPN